jgi:hypothetical protein
MCCLAAPPTMQPLKRFLSRMVISLELLVTIVAVPNQSRNRKKQLMALL